MAKPNTTHLTELALADLYRAKDALGRVDLRSMRSDGELKDWLLDARAEVDAAIENCAGVVDALTTAAAS